MAKRNLLNVTLLGIDCVDIDRLIRVADICSDAIEFGQVKLLTSKQSSHKSVVQIAPVLDREQYSRFVIKRLNEYVSTQFALIIQYDGFILNPEAWQDEFLRYDYIGAPWWYEDGMNVGNGGFSIRSKRLLEVLARDTTVSQYFPEDHHICRTFRKHLEKQGIRFAPENLAQKFSKEGISSTNKPGSNNVWNGQFGFHGLHKTDISKWLAAHPEVDFIENRLKPNYLPNMQ
jgi:hypothetical protein